MKRLLLALFILASAVPAHAGITFFGRTNTPADNGAQTDAAERTVTPPATMLTNDYVIVYMTTNNATATAQVHSNPTTGGQTWAKSTQCVSSAAGGVTIRTSIFSARFNGTWAADPGFSTTNASASGMTLVMDVWRGVATSSEFDVAITCATYAAPGSPFDVSIAAINTVTNNSMAIGAWNNIELNTWALQTGGWTASNPTQVRNTSGTDTTTAAGAYKIQATAGSTGAVVSRQGTAARLGTTMIFALKEATTSTRRQQRVILVQ